MKLGFTGTQHGMTAEETEEQLRSGTWATIRYAKKKNKHVVIVNPDGSVTEFNDGY